MRKMIIPKGRFEEPKVKCPKCKATGVIICPVCKGSGKDPRNTDKPCSYCDGRGTKECDLCQGSCGVFESIANDFRD